MSEEEEEDWIDLGAAVEVYEGGMNQNLGRPAAIVDKFRPHFTELLSEIGAAF
jgi:hypothetical protein